MAFPLLAIPGIIGAIGSLFGGGKGKPTQYSPMATPQAQAAYQNLLAMIQGMMKKNQGVSAGVQPTTDALNLLYSKFFNRPYVPNVSMSRPTGMGTISSSGIPGTPAPRL